MPAVNIVPPPRGIWAYILFVKKKLDMLAEQFESNKRRKRMEMLELGARLAELEEKMEEMEQILPLQPSPPPSPSIEHESKTYVFVLNFVVLFLILLFVSLCFRTSP